MAKEDANYVTTSDVNLTSYLAYKDVNIARTRTTSERGRVRVWFDFNIDEKEFDLLKNEYFSRSDESLVQAQRLLQERERVYSLMIQTRNSANVNQR